MAESNWTNLRRVNYMLDNMHKCRGRVSDEIYNHYEGVARFWRAWFYYDKVRTFGAVLGTTSRSRPATRRL